MTNKIRITSIGLIILVTKTPDPYLAHLSGINKPPSLLPFTLPYKPTNRPMFSEMSFKCRSTSSFSSSSYTLTDPNSDPLYTLYPTRPEKAYGLGIYAPEKSITTNTSSVSSFSTTNFLTPRPSLKTIRGQASLGDRPRLHLYSKSYPVTSTSSSLPPVPTYNPEKYKTLPALRAGRKYPSSSSSSSSSGPPPPQPLPPRRAYTLKRRGSRGTLRVVLRSPSCPLMFGGELKEQEGNLDDDDDDDKYVNNAINNPLLARPRSPSAESLSSVYSRSLSGDDPDLKPFFREETETEPAAAAASTMTVSGRQNHQQQQQQQQVPPDSIEPPRTSSSSTARTIPLPLRPIQPPSSRPRRALRPPQSGGGPRAHAPSSRSSHHHQPRNLKNTSSGLGGHQVQMKMTTTSTGEEAEQQNGSRLPVARAVSGFGDVRDWSCGGGERGGRFWVGMAVVPGRQGVGCRRFPWVERELRF